MPIIFPSHCQGVTAGALRQIKRDGITTASGGLFAADRLAAVQAHTRDYFEPREPAGEFMQKIENVKVQIDDITEAIGKSTQLMVSTARDANKQMADVTGKMRDGAEKLGGAIDKMLKIAGKGDFAETVRLTESLVCSLERLAELENQGVLDKVMRAMRRD